ncbi:hypothetical protein GUITHDRAFT_100324 [Guillardia theta CCMP2712]|uniref:Uncharacterized protein n=3 Tax=Guillardia theta TaxID=55529 RepID=L1K0U6_GUITC|nr:hypothetical protein GUITHDRAFT_100324 [Guillardia theta CCMP2712]EKX54075.1 hypothetical protein GUITHDRAFT_100324 [Guillardia theta CCMP2712]|eukprot:XP_005841055.1 hypothetical protein GUITHDRAFT_100324 [Guillardia theta CCMP2712]
MMFGGATAPSAPGFAMGGSMPGMPQMNLELPPVFDLAKLDSLERALAGDDSDDFGKAIGNNGSEFREQLLGPFFAGYEKRRQFEENLKMQTQVNLPPGNPMGQFSMMQSAQPVPQLQSSSAQIESRLAQVFTFEKILVQAGPNALQRYVADSALADFAKVGLTDMKDKPIASHEIDPILSVALEVARELRENLVRSLHLVLLAKRSTSDANDAVIKREAFKHYFAQQRRVLTLICRILRDLENTEDMTEGWLAQHKICHKILTEGDMRVCEKVVQAFKDNLDRHASLVGLTQAASKEKRNGIEGEMCLFCEILQGILSIPDQSKLQLLQWNVFEGNLNVALSFFFDKLGFEMEKTREKQEAGINARDECVTFYGTMVSCAICRAVQAGQLVYPGKWQPFIDSMARKLKCGQEEILGDSARRPHVGFIQLLLAQLALACSDDNWRRYVKHAVSHHALTFVNTNILPCSLLDRWSDYRERIWKDMENFLDNILMNPILDEVVKLQVGNEQGFPSPKYEMLINLLGSTAKVYANLPAMAQALFETRGSSLFERGALEVLKKTVIKHISNEEDVRFRVSLRSALLELFHALFNSIPSQVTDRAQSGVFVDWFEQLVQQIEPLLTSNDRLCNLNPSNLIRELQEYASSICRLLELELPRSSGYYVSAERQQMVSSYLGHSRGRALQTHQEGFFVMNADQVSERFECDTVEYHVNWLRLLQSLLRAIKQLHNNVGKTLTDIKYELSHELKMQELFLLWSMPLAPEIKAEIVLLLDSLAAYCVHVQNHGIQELGSVHDIVLVIWRDFMQGTVLQTVQVLDQHPQMRQQWTAGQVTAFYVEFLDIDRRRGTYSHTLSFLRLLNTIFEREIPYRDNTIQVLQSCIALLPPAEASQSNGGSFLNASHRWQVSTAVLRLVVTFLNTMMETMRSGSSDWSLHGGRPLFDQVLSWIVLSESDVANGGWSLRSQVLSILVLGLQIAEESEIQSELPHLASTIEMALRLFHVALSICLSIEQYYTLALVDAVLSERGRSRTSGRKTSSLLVTLMCYAALQEEPTLAGMAIQLLQLICKEKDEESPEANPQVSGCLLQLLLDSLSHVEDECCTAHYLLGFDCFQMGETDLNRMAPACRLLNVLYELCADTQRWSSEWEMLNQMVFQGGGRGQETSMMENEVEASMESRALLQGNMQRREQCMEIFFRLTMHRGTRQATIQYLMEPRRVEGKGAGGGEGKRLQTDGLLVSLGRSMPFDLFQRQNAVIKAVRSNIKDLLGGGELGRKEREQGMPFEKLWDSGKRDKPDEEAEEEWVRQIPEYMSSSGVHRDSSELDLLVELMELRWAIEEEEKCLQDVLEWSMKFFHVCGWYMRILAVLLATSRSSLEEGAASSRQRGGVSRDDVQQLLQVLFGESEYSGGYGNASSLLGGLGERSFPVWSRGKFQLLLVEAIDVPDVEMDDSEALPELLEDADIQDCTRPVDRWTDMLLMCDEKRMQDRLFKVLSSRRVDGERNEKLLDALAEHYIRKRILGPYDGYNTVRRCRSAREHLLCGLQDVLEQVLFQGSMSAILRLEPPDYHVFLFDLLDLLRRVETSLSQPQVASHLIRCLSIVIAAVASSSRRDPSSASKVRSSLLGFLDFIMALPMRTQARSSVALRGDLYAAILKLLEFLRSSSEPLAATPGPSGRRVGDVERVMKQHKLSLLQVALADIAVRHDKPMGEEEDSRALALGVIQSILPCSSRRSKGSSVETGEGAGDSLSLRGIIAHFSLVDHLTDDLDGHSQLGEVLDVTRTEERQPLLLLFTCKVSILLQLAQDPEGLSELTEGKVMQKLARASFLRSHITSESQVRSLLRSDGTGGVLCQRFHLLLLPTLKLFVALLHDAAEGSALLLPALQFLWNHQLLLRELFLAASSNDGVAPGEELGELVEERRLVVEAVLLIEKMGGFSLKQEASALQNGTAGGTVPRAGSAAAAAAAAAGRGSATAAAAAAAAEKWSKYVNMSRELDGKLLDWIGEFASVLFLECSKSSFWQHVAGDPSAGWLGNFSSLPSKKLSKGARKAVHMLQTSELIMRLLLLRAGGVGWVSSEDPSRLLVSPFHCLRILPSRENRAMLWESSSSKKDLGMESLISFFCRIVEHLCGCGGDAWMGTAHKGLAITDGRSSGRLTSGGAMSFWSRYCDLQQQRISQDDDEDDMETRHKRRSLEFQFQAVDMQFRRIMRMSEVALSLIVECLSSCHVPKEDKRSRPSFFSENFFQSTSDLESLWNRQRTGAAQRLLQFYRDRYQENTFECDCVYIKQVVDRLAEELQRMKAIS